MNKLAKLFANKKRGFTLIELIVVIAILGILAAILVPSMIGFINDANQGQLKANVRSAYSAAQAYYASETSKGKTVAAITSDNIEQYMGAVPSGATVTITMSGTPATIATVEWEAAAGTATYTTSTGAITFA